MAVACTGLTTACLMMGTRMRSRRMMGIPMAHATGSRMSTISHIRTTTRRTGTRMVRFLPTETILRMD
ncbi:hypothetical protein A9X02_27630 [Mycobacterium malmoense]|nr:hypothetical protein A9X02_27630 [Mycobacterium malmoense]